MKKKAPFVAVGVLVLLCLPLLALKGHLAGSAQEIVAAVIALAMISIFVYF